MGIREGDGSEGHKLGWMGENKGEEGGREGGGGHEGAGSESWGESGGEESVKLGSRD